MGHTWCPEDTEASTCLFPACPASGCTHVLLGVTGQLCSVLCPDALASPTFTLLIEWWPTRARAHLQKPPGKMLEMEGVADTHPSLSPPHLPTQSCITSAQKGEQVSQVTILPRCTNQRSASVWLLSLSNVPFCVGEEKLKSSEFEFPSHCVLGL